MFRTKSCLAWLRSWFQPRKKPVRRAEKAAAKPRLEALEDRLAPTATPTHVYELNGSLADQLGGPSLLADGGTLDATRYTFDANEGLRLIGALTTPSTYSIVMVAELDSLEPFFKKIIDFENRTQDWGVYVEGANFQLYPGGSGTGAITENTDFQFVFTRDGVTGIAKIYLNGVLQQTYASDISVVAIVPGNVLTFFEDDTLSGGAEAAGGSVDRIAIYDVALTAADIGALDAAPPIVAAANQTVVAPEGQTAANFGTWSDPNGDTVTLAASAGTLIQHANGTWSWSFTTSDGPDQTQSVTITATDSTGAVSFTTFNAVVTNVPPSVTRDVPSVTVDEGQTASNTGHWSDPGVDVVTLSASVGTVNKNADGTWSWSFDSSDGPDQSQTVTITATDSDGASTDTTFNLVVNNAAPSVTRDQASVAVNEGLSASNTGHWSDPGADVVTLSASVGTVTKNADGTWSWSFASSDGPDQSQTVTITATDSDGQATSTTFSLVVNNAAPSVARNQASVTVNEGQSAANSGVWSDPGADVVTLSASVGSVTKNADGTWSWSFASSDGPDQSQTVTITATDSDGAANSTTFSLVVNNVAPSVSRSQATVTVNAGQTASNTGNWSDPGADVVTLTASVGTVTKNADGTWSWSFTAGQSQTVTITATDSDGAASSTTFNLVVNNNAGSVSLVGGTLFVTGTAGKDFVGIDARQNGTVLHVDARFQIGTTAYQNIDLSFAMADVNLIVVDTGASNDVVNIHNDVCIDAIILGGDGDDILQGGSATNVLVGGDGNDLLFGGRKANILIGGRGADQLFGRGRQNVLLGGSVAIENNVAALTAALAHWNGGQGTDPLPEFGPLPGDLSRDRLHGC